MGRRGGGKRGGGGGGGHEDQYGSVGDEDRDDHHGGGGGGGHRGGGGAGGGGPSASTFTFQRALPKFLQPHAHLLGAGASTPASDAAADADADAAFADADARDAAAAALRENPTETDPALLAAAGRARGDEAKEKGNAAFKRKNFDAAVTHYAAAVAAVGGRGAADAAPYLANLAAAHGAAGRWGDALEDATAAARARPGWAKAWIRVGEAATGLGRWSEAVTAYDRAVALQPGDEKAQIALARARGAESRAVSEGKVTFVKRAAPAPAAAARQAPPDAKRARPAAGKLSFADEEDEEDE